MKGKISQWKDEKGFGFIQPDDGSEKLFFHISSVKNNARIPQVGDSVLYDSMRDAQQRLKARSVVIEGVDEGSRPAQRRQSARTDGPRKDVFDYVAMLVILFSVAAVGYELYRARDLEGSLLFGLPAVVAFLMLNRQKKPKAKSFSCSRCGVVAEHDARTILAWNNGSTKLYCRNCHHQWLKDNPQFQRERDGVQQGSGRLQSQGRGCLGIVALMGVIPVLSGVALYQWIL